MSGKNKPTLLKKQHQGLDKAFKFDKKEEDEKKNFF